MHVRLQFLQPLLVLNAEMLLFIDDEQTEILEFDRVAEQRMRADDNIDRSFFQSLLAAASSFVPTRREAWARLIGRPWKRFEKVLKCWRDRSVVGTTIAT